MRLHGAMIYVKDLARMTVFYELSLGLAPIPGSRSDSWVEFDAGGCLFGLHAIPPDLAAGIELTSPCYTAPGHSSQAAI